MTYLDKHMTELPSLKRLAQFLSSEARLSEMEGRYDVAANIHLEVMRLGQASARGGLMIDKLVGVAVENIGLTGLARMFTHLNTESCRSTIKALKELDADASSALVYLKRDRQWGRKATGTSALSAWIQSVLMTKMLRQTDRKFTARLAATDRHRRKLLLNLASRAYELENGKRPLRAEELVPSLLRAVPKDPETGTNLVLNSVP